jgi:small subunit ribosomal protein S17
MTKTEVREKVIKRKLTGVVVSDANDKTVVVQVNALKSHPIYKKRYKESKKYMAHDPENTFKVGDNVSIELCRPFSKKKRWRVITDTKKSA